MTIADLAAELGLSTTTISDALAGSGRVSYATRAKVQQAAAQVGYVYNRAARALRKGSSGAVGLYFPSAGRSLAFYMDFTFGAADAANGNDLDLTILTDSRPATRDLAVDGVIIVDARAGDPFIDQLVDSGVPLVTAGRLPDSYRDRAAVIEADHQQVARAMFEYLWSQGAQKVAFICPDDSFNSSWARDVRTSYSNWCRSRGLPELLRPLTISPSDAELRECLTDVLPPLRPAGEVTGVVCAAQSLAGQTLAALMSMGIRVNHDVLLGGLVGDPAELDSPLISTVDLHARAFGAESVELLLLLLSGQVKLGSITHHRADLILAGDREESISGSIGRDSMTDIGTHITALR
ncbi:MAG: LacI family DNA-binding transcriptional regulator [Streptosporangiaceae bacterium]